MLGQVVEVVESDRYLSVEYGSMLVRSKTALLGRVPLDDIAALIVNPHGATVSAGLLAALAQRNVPVVISGNHFKPVAIVMPLIGHHEISARIQAQADASKPTQKQAWKQIVSSKVEMQSLVLQYLGRDFSKIELMLPNIRSGDSTNVEARAARAYWRQIFGSEFRRDQDAEGVNALLNYGYAIIRAATARAIAASGLHPSIGIHHKHPLDTMRLVDDIMEPYRPIVDLRVHAIAESEERVEVVPRTKKMLVNLLSMDVPTEAGTSPLTVAIYRTARSFVKYLKGERDQLELPGKALASQCFGAISEAWV